MSCVSNIPRQLFPIFQLAAICRIGVLPCDRMYLSKAAFTGTLTYNKVHSASMWVLTFIGK